MKNIKNTKKYWKYRSGEGGLGNRLRQNLKVTS